MQDYYIWFNVLLYFFTLLFYLKKKKKFSAVSYILSIYLLSSVCGIIFFYSGQRTFFNIGIIPFIYFYIVFILTLLPIVAIENKIEDGINHSDKIIVTNYHYIKILGYFILVVSAIPFIESCILFIQSSGMDTSYLVEAHDQRQVDDEYERAHTLSAIGDSLFRFCVYFRDLAPVLLFFFLSKEKKNKWIIAGLLMMILTNNILGYLNSGRSVLVSTFISFLFLYFLYKKYLDVKVVKKIKRYGIPILSLILILIATITVVRFNHYFDGRSYSNISVLQWVSLYAGEGMLNFNEYVWNMNGTMEGDYSFSYFKDLLGLDTFSSTIERRAYWEPIIGIPQHIFYTYVGNIVEDLGTFGGFLFFSIFSSIIFVIIKKARHIYLHNIFLIFIWAKILLGGYAFYCYSGTDGKVLLINVLLYCALKLIYITKYNKVSNFK